MSARPDSDGWVARDGSAARPARGLLYALRDHLVAPAAPPVRERPATAHATAAVPPSLAVLADPSDVAPLAVAVALLTAAERRAPCAAVVLRGARRSLPHAGPAVPAARRLAASLVARGLDCAATGRIVAVLVESEEPTAAAAGAGAAGAMTAADGPDRMWHGREAGDAMPAAAERALAAASSAGAVAVVGVGAPLEPSFDRVLSACDLGLVLVRPAQARLLDLAVDGLAGLGLRTEGAVAPVGLPARLVTMRGLAVAPSLRSVLAPLVAGVAVRA